MLIKYNITVTILDSESEIIPWINSIGLSQSSTTSPFSKRLLKAYIKFSYIALAYFLSLIYPNSVNNHSFLASCMPITISLYDGFIGTYKTSFLYSSYLFAIHCSSLQLKSKLNSNSLYLSVPLIFFLSSFVVFYSYSYSDYYTIWVWVCYIFWNFCSSNSLNSLVTLF